MEKPGASNQLSALLAIFTLFSTSLVFAKSGQEITTRTLDVAGVPMQLEYRGDSIRTVPDKSPEFVELYDQLSPQLTPATGKPNTDQALLLLKQLEAISKNPYETDLVHQTYGFAYYSKGDIKSAIEQFHAGLANSNSIPRQTEMINLRMLAALYKKEKNYGAALKTMTQWLSVSDELTNKDYLEFSNLQDHLGKTAFAIANLEKALMHTSFDDSKTIAAYYKTKVALLRKNQQADAANLLESFITAWKKPSSKTLPLPLEKGPPVYPFLAVASRAEGICLVTFGVDAQGKITNPHVKPGNCITKDGNPTDLFSKASIKALSGFLYAPYEENGTPIEVNDLTHAFVYEMGS